MRLGQKRITEIFHPGRILAHHRQQGRESDKRFNAGIPRLAGNSLNGGIPFHGGVILGPLHGLHDVVRVGGGHQHLRQQTVRIERDGGNPLINLRLGVGGGYRLRGDWLCGWSGCRRSLRRRLRDRLWSTALHIECSRRRE